MARPDNNATPVTRRGVLGTTVSGLASGLIPGSAGGTQQTTPTPEDDNYEDREWGKVRAEYEPPEVGNRPVILSVDGYQHGSPSHYLEMRDGTLVAVDIFVDPDDRIWRSPPVADEYICVHASIRGSGCSGGTFDLFDRTHAKDGYEIVEWLADRPWADGQVGLYGFSYSGWTGFFIAAEQPPSLTCVSTNLLTADLYRDLVFPGGVPNTVFPAAWALVLRPSRGTYGSAFEGIVQDQDQQCAENVATRGIVSPLDHPATWYTRRTDDTTWRSRSLITYADRVEVPVYIAHAWQDEQSDARGGPEIFRAVDPDPASPPGTPSGQQPRHDSPKLLRATNGVHKTGEKVNEDDASAWFDYWMRGKETGIMNQAPFKLHLNRGTESSTTFDLSDYPDPSTSWTRYYLASEGTLSEAAPGKSQGVDTYLTGSPRRNWFFEEPGAGQEISYAEGPDILTYRSEPFDEPWVLAGPMTATLYIECSAPEMDLYVGVGAQRDGQFTPLQRGCLRASHRRLDEDRTLYNDNGDIVRPYRPHESPEPITPGEIYRYDVEVFPAGHLLYPGDRLTISVTTPPLLDGLSGYEPSRTPGVNRLYRNQEHPSSIIFPLHAWPDDRELPPQPACGKPKGYRCIDVGQ